MTTEVAERPKTILIIDDEDLIRVAVKMFLEDIGHRTLEASNASEAIVLLEELGPSIDVLFTDVHMPGKMDGLALAELAKKQWPHLNIIVTSGRIRISPNAVPEKAKFIPKPYDFSQLEQVIQAAE